MGTQCLQIPCSAMPFICEADYSVTMMPMIHVDRTAPFHVAIYLLKGWMEIVEDGTAYELLPNQLFFLKSGVHHWGERPFEPGSAWYYAHFYCEEPGDGTAELVMPSGEGASQGKRVYSERIDQRSYITLPKRSDCEKNGRIEREFEKLIRTHHTGNLPRTSIHMWNIFVESARLLRESVPESGYVRSMLDYIEKNYVGSITSAELEKVCGLSYKYASTLFKEAVGKTVKEYQYMLRLELAEKLLRETELPIGEIALRTGFSDIFYFSRIFRRERGCTPSQYRRTYVPGI